MFFLSPFFLLFGSVTTAADVGLFGKVDAEVPAMSASWCYTYMTTYLAPVTIASENTVLASSDSPLRTKKDNPTVLPQTQGPLSSTPISRPSLSPVEGPDIEVSSVPSILSSLDLMSSSGIEPAGISSTASQRTPSLPDKPTTTFSPAQESTDPGRGGVIFFVQPNSGLTERMLKKRTLGGFVSGNGNVENADSCSDAALFNLVSGQLSFRGNPIYYAKGDTYKRLRTLDKPPSGAITETFSVVGGNLQFRNSASLPQGQANFCQDPAGGQVYITFESEPPGCVPVSLRVYTVEQCLDGRIDTDGPNSSSAPISTSSGEFIQDLGTSSTSKVSSKTTSLSTSTSTLKSLPSISQDKTTYKFTDAIPSTSRRSTVTHSSISHVSTTSSLSKTTSIKLSSTSSRSVSGDDQIATIATSALRNSTLTSISKSTDATTLETVATDPTASAATSAITTTTTTSSCETNAVPSIMLASPTTIFGNDQDYDDNWRFLELPFPVGAYGNYESIVLVSTNGLVSLYQGTEQFSNYPLPDYGLPWVSILPYFHDLAIARGSGLGIFYDVYDAENGQQATIEWLAMTVAAPGTYYHFALTFYESMPGLINITYYSTDGKGDRATVGVQNVNQEAYLMYEYNTAGSIPDQTYLVIDTREWPGSASVGELAVPSSC